MNLPRVLITGAGGPAAVAALRALHLRADLYAVDIDAYAVGLYLVAADHRALAHRGDDPQFVDHLLDLVERWNIDVLIPTVDVELIPTARAIAAFSARGCAVMVPSVASLERTIDKYHLTEALAGHPSLPTTALIDAHFHPGTWESLGQQWPAIVKPRLGSGGRGVMLVHGPDELAVERDATQILQEFLPGHEISVDVLARRDGHVAAAVPRLRLKVDSGIAVAGETVHDHDAITIATTVVTSLGLAGPLNVQLKHSVNGQWKLLEINPRLPGSSPLTRAAGVDLVGLALTDLLGEAIDDWFDFADIAMVRHWDDVVIASGEFQRTPVAAGMIGAPA
jgi:carbamoyl-phosphate synthase large subunit